MTDSVRIPVRVNLAELPGVQLPDGTPVDWVDVAVIDRTIDLMLNEGADQAGIPALVPQVLTGQLSYAQQHGGRWSVDIGTVTTPDGVTTVQLLAERHDGHGWIVMFDVPA